MNRNALAILSTVVTTFLILENAAAYGQELDEAKDAQEAMKPKVVDIHVLEFRGKNPIGYLGRPLGTVLRAQGVVVDGDKTRTNGYLGKQLLEVDSVNGKPLSASFLFEVPLHPDKVTIPAVGERFDFLMYEYGEFSGLLPENPDRYDVELPPIPNDGFHYRSLIHILKNFESK